MVQVPVPAPMLALPAVNLEVRQSCKTMKCKDGRTYGALTGASRLAGYAVREQLPLPDKPPYTAHLGNLSFEVTEADVQDFLSGCEVTSVRIVEDKLDRRPKGFGYVEFGTVEGLKKALTLSDSQFQGRNIRVSVADPRKYPLPLQHTPHPIDISS